MRANPSTPLPTISAQPRWHVVDNAQWLATALAWVERAANAAVADQGEFHIVLAGGGTPEKLYRALAERQHDWRLWHIWFGDERCRPCHDSERNSRMAATAWLDRIDIPRENIHIIPAELGAETAARMYAEEVGELKEFDLVLLGLGQDGHTASLFPDHDWGSSPESPDALPVLDAPKPPPERVTLSARRLSRTRCVLFLICGADKRQALARWRQGANIPAAAVQPPAGPDLLIDADAFPPGEPK